MTPAVPTNPQPQEKRIKGMSSDSRPVWSSGVGGAQCDDCGEITIVRHFGSQEPGLDDDEWLCRSCYEGWDE